MLNLPMQDGIYKSYTPLALAVFKDATDVVAVLLRTEGVELDCCTKKDGSLLHQVSLQGNVNTAVRTIRLLFELHFQCVPKFGLEPHSSTQV